MDLETLPMILKSGSILNSDIAHFEHPPMLLHLESNHLRDVSFSNAFINDGFSCLSTLT